MKWQNRTASNECECSRSDNGNGDADAMEKGSNDPLPVATATGVVKTTRDRSTSITGIDAAAAAAAVDNKTGQRRRCYFPIRLMVAILACFGTFNTNSLRLNMSIGLVAMVNESAIRRETPATTTTTTTTFTRMCAIPESSANVSFLQAHDHRPEQDGPFAWDEATRGALLSAYFWGNVFGQIPGGIVADRFGGKWSFGLGIFVSSVVTLFMPRAAFIDVRLLFALRVLCGFAQAMALPALFTLLVHWVPHDEKGRLAGLTYSGVSLGKVAVFPISGILCDSNFLGGWPAVFYVFGAVGIVWSLVWIMLVHDDPADDPKVSKQELMHIQDNVSVKATSTRKRRINWRQLTTSGPLWALLFAYFSSSWGAQILLTMLPSYLKFAMGFDMKSSGLVNGLPHIVAVVVGLAASWCADAVQGSRKCSPTNTRKLFAAIAMLMPMICLLGVTFLECNRTGLILLLTLAVAFAAVNSGGLFINEMDLSMKLAGTLKGMTNFAANLSGIVAPYAAGLLINDNASLTEWNKVFYLSAAILLVGAVVFLFFGSADDQHFCDFDDDDDDQSDTERIVPENNNYRRYGSTNPEEE